MARNNIQHFRKKCIGCASCAEIAPQFWRMSKADGKAILVNGKKSNNCFLLPILSFDTEINKKVAENCPVKIIQVNN